MPCACWEVLVLSSCDYEPRVWGPVVSSMRTIRKAVCVLLVAFLWGCPIRWEQWRSPWVGHPALRSAAMPAFSVLTGSALGVITACSGSLCQAVLGVTQPGH